MITPGPQSSHKVPLNRWAFAALATSAVCAMSVLGADATPPKKSGSSMPPKSYTPPKSTPPKTFTPPKTTTPPHTHTPPKTTTPPHTHKPPVTTTPPHTHTPPHTTSRPPIHVNILPPLTGYPIPPTYATPPTYVIPNQPQVTIPAPVTPIPQNQLPPATQTVVKPNLPPGQQIATQILKPNPQLVAAAVTYDMLLDAYQAVQAEQQQQLDGITESLGPEMMADPGVAAAINNIQDKINNGELVTDADLAAVNDAVVNALNNGVPITGGATQASVNQALGSLETLSEIQQVIQFWPPDGGNIPIPVGITDIIFDPFLPVGGIFVTPGGAILDGTGGVGGFGMGQGTLADAVGLPSGEGAPLPASNDPSGCMTSGLLVMNPPVNAVGMEYVINNQNYSTPAGYNQTFNGPGSWLVQFNRGPGFGDARYSLKEGSYYFTSKGQGWELYEREFTAVVDNAENSKPFEYVVGNSNVSVAPGQSQTHTSRYPICIRFDRGGGNQPAQRLVSDPTVKTARLRVAISPSDNLWDLFPAENFARVEAPAPAGIAAPAATPGAAATVVPSVGPTVPPAPGLLRFGPAPATKDGKLKFPPAKTKTQKKWPTQAIAKKKVSTEPAPMPAELVPTPEANKQ